MFPSVVLPLTIAIGLAILVTTAHRLLPPVVAARVVTITLAVVGVAALPTLWIFSLGYVARLPLLGGRLEWCATAFGVHDPISSWLGVPAVALSIAGLVRARAVANSYRQLRHHHPGNVEIADHVQPFAFTLPGRGGRVVVSSALVDMLDDDEQGVVLAHERAHAQHRHDRYLLTAQLAAAFIPPLRPLSGRLQFSLERWADESAVTHCGDRGFVARTLAKVALSSIRPAGALGFSGLGVPARVAALMSPPMNPLRRSTYAMLWAAIVITSGLAAFQIHHMARFITALCPG